MTWRGYSFRGVVAGLAALAGGWLAVPVDAAAPRDKDWRPVQVTMTVSPGAAPSTALVALNLRIEKTWYIYVKSSTSTVLQVDLELPPGVKADGDWQRPTPRVVYQDEKVEIYVGDQVLTRTLKIDPSFSGELTVNARVRYQACDPSVCMPADEVRVAAKMERR
jgi:hypothetical protein